MTSASPTTEQGATDAMVEQGGWRIPVRYADQSAEIAHLKAEAERAKVMIGARLDSMTPLQRECAINEAWHVLAALTSGAVHDGLTRS